MGKVYNSVSNAYQEAIQNSEKTILFTLAEAHLW
jgi:hypothetical protein